ncbi:MAG TPA: DnaJ domain-containing protein [Polyangiaceae bacterium]|nr:DnaJ domain-containing protein [Polyangiaceae bacterium]
MTQPGQPDEFLFAWLDVLDQLTYYELFGIAVEATPDEVRTAFHRFCDTFHPDRHSGRTQAEREAVSKIFKRGTEACLVLSDASLRAQYDAQLTADPHERPPRMSQAPRTRPPTQGPARSTLEDAARSPSSRPFARRAEELIQVGDLRQAKLQLVMANHLEPGNGALAAALKDIEARLAGTK